MGNKKIKKNAIAFKNISDSCIEFQLNNIFISDNEYLYLAPNTNFCRTCFNRRHQTQTMANEVVTTRINANTLNFAHIIEKNIKSIFQQWHVYIVEQQQLAASFIFIPYEDCPVCSKQKTVEKKYASEQYKNSLIQTEKTNLADLKQRVFSFGFARSRSNTKDIGLNNPELNKLMGDNTQARIIYRIITKTGQFTDESALGFSTNKELAEIKSIMEYLERYAFFLHISRFPTNESDDQLINQFLQLYRTKATSEELKAIQRNSSWGINLHTNETQAIPTSFIFKNNQVSFIHPSTSGFAAHTNFKKSLCSSILELIERDAFVRFWHDPELAFNFEPDALTKSETNKLISILETVIDNNEMESKFYLLKSATRIPVILITISSNNIEKPPSLNFGIGVGSNINEAMSGALEELRLNTVNLAKGISVIDGFLTQKFTGNIDSLLSRMSLYSSSAARKKLKFLDNDNPLRDGIYEDLKQPTLEDLVARLYQTNHDIYGIDCTPQCFLNKNVYVTRAFSPQLYPLQLSNEDVFNLPTGKLSAKNDLPHFFI